jgi:hypothetical protein
VQLEITAAVAAPVAPSLRLMSAEPLPETITTRATVYAGSNATDYVHTGRGIAVVLISDRSDHPLVVPLAAHFRVIAPEVPRRAAGPDSGTPSPSFFTWLRDFLDCLGIEQVNLVVENSTAVDALRFRDSDPGRVHRVVVLAGDATNPEVADDVVRALLGGQRDTG